MQKKKPPIIIFKPFISPKKKHNEKYTQYMVQTLLIFKPFTNRNEITTLCEQDLETKFNSFIVSDDCPFFVKNKYNKANKKRTKNKPSNEQQLLSSQDEIVEAQLENSSDEESDTEDDNVSRNVPNNTESENQFIQQSQSDNDAVSYRPQIAKFLEPYQEFGHMAPKGFDYEGMEYGYFDDDSDVLE